MSLPKINVPLHELTIPSTGKKIKYRPFVVKEEKLLLLAMESDSTEEITNAIVQIINNCVQSKIDVEELSTFDIEYIFLNVRAKSVGEFLEFSITCPDDNQTQVEVEINIDDIKVVKSDSHTDLINLENGYFVKMKYPTMKYIMSKKDIGNKTAIENTFDYAVDCIDQIYNDEEVWESANSTRKEMEEWVETLEPKQYEKLQDFFNTMPKLKHTVPITNPATGVKSDVTIEGLANFFA
jgi:prefoldin subunit 5